MTRRRLQQELPLTLEERCFRLVTTVPTLNFIGERDYPSGFTSHFGIKRGKKAYVFAAEKERYLFTLQETRLLKELGATVPSGSLR